MRDRHLKVMLTDLEPHLPSLNFANIQNFCLVTSSMVGLRETLTQQSPVVLQDRKSSVT